MRSRKPKRIELEITELEAILDRAKAALSAEDNETLKAAIETLGWLTSEVEKKNASLARLRKLLFGTKKTEKKSNVLNEGKEKNTQEAEKKKKKRKGHGRNGASDYKGAERIKVPHEWLKPRDSCPDCEKGKVYKERDPHVLVRVRSHGPFDGKVYESEALRCNLCGTVFPAKPPPGIGDKKYHETAVAMIALLKYGYGMPFCRLERMARNLGIPLPASTQWDTVEEAADIVVLVLNELIRQAAQGQVVYNDDTSARILDLMEVNKQIEKAGTKERTGIFTSGVVSTNEGRRIALFFTGRNHAGENLEEVLKQRAAQLPPPIHMSDAASRNIPKDLATLMCNCLTHGRRYFVDLIDCFPEECRHVIETLAEVYRNDAITREKEMSPQERLRFHQAKSGKVMADLQRWMTAQLAEKKVEPNSSLGRAFSYMLKRWNKLTLFLRVPGAPLDNNICERALKKAILHRKNSLFYKTENGARVGDTFMSVIYTAELSGVNPFDYLTTLLKNPEHLRRHPHEWMPWNYQATAAALAEARDPPSAEAPP